MCNRSLALAYLRISRPARSRGEPSMRGALRQRWANSRTTPAGRSGSALSGLAAASCWSSSRSRHSAATHRRRRTRPRRSARTTTRTRFARCSRPLRARGVGAVLRALRHLARGEPVALRSPAGGVTIWHDHARRRRRGRRGRVHRRGSHPLSRSPRRPTDQDAVAAVRLQTLDGLDARSWVAFNGSLGVLMLGGGRCSARPQGVSGARLDRARRRRRALSSRSPTSSA